MPKQDYVINIRKAVVGTLYGISYTNSERLSARANSVIEFGVGIKPVSGKDRNADVGCAPDSVIATQTYLYGISLRSIGREMSTYPGDGVVKYKVNDEIAFVREGTIHVTNMGATAATEQGNVFCHPTTGLFSADATGGYLLVQNAKWTSNTAAGAIGRVTITIARQLDNPIT